MKIAIITGSYPPDTCGIGDYTSQLVSALTEKGVIVEVFHKADWSLSNLSTVAQSIGAINADVLHMQYPTAGFGRKLTPQLLSLLLPGVVTVHEATRAHVLRKLSLYPFSMRSKHVVFTTQFERDFCLKFAPWISNRSSVIPVGSSIRTSSRTNGRNPDEIVYFGLFRPNKGLEEVFILASLIKQKGLDLRVRLIGKPYPEGSPYSQELFKRAEELPIQWDIDLPEDAVADRLAGASYAYMPFPDGASGRRTSLLALLANGVATITTLGTHTPADLSQSVLFSDSPGHALRLIEQLRTDTGRWEQLSKNAREYANIFSWDSISARHVELYQSLIRERICRT